VAIGLGQLFDESTPPRTGLARDKARRTSRARTNKQAATSAMACSLTAGPGLQAQTQEASQVTIEKKTFKSGWRRSPRSLALGSLHVTLAAGMLQPGPCPIWPLDNVKHLALGVRSPSRLDPQGPVRGRATRITCFLRSLAPRLPGRLAQG